MTAKTQDDPTTARPPPEGRLLFRFKPPEMTKRQRGMTDICEEYAVVALEDHVIESSEMLAPHNSVVIYGWISWKGWEANVSARPVVYELMKMVGHSARLMRDNDPDGRFWTPSADLVLPGEGSAKPKTPEFRCSGCGWEGHESDLIEPCPDEPPECPGCGLPFEGPGFVLPVSGGVQVPEDLPPEDAEEIQAALEVDAHPVFTVYRRGC